MVWFDVSTVGDGGSRQTMELGLWVFFVFFLVTSRLCLRLFGKKKIAND